MRYFITGSGTLGSALIKRLQGEKVIVYSNDEYGQSELARKYPYAKYWLGDVRDLERLKDACEDADVIIHTAAQKRMDTASQNAFEVADVNIRGTYNVCLAGKGKKIIFVSTDKAFNPTCIYGASKMIAEGIALAHNAVVWRFGNFIGSRGSVWEIFKEQAAKGEALTVTNPEATRFVIDVDTVCSHLLSKVKPGLHYPKNLRKMSVGEIAKSIAPDAYWEIVGLREGEKLHESFTEDYSSKK